MLGVVVLRVLREVAVGPRFFDVLDDLGSGHFVRADPETATLAPFLQSAE